MSLARPYEIVAPLTVCEELRAPPRRDRRQLEEFLFRLTRPPSLPRDFESPAEDERSHQAKIVGNWLISYWPDHAAREIRLTGCERIE
ncbi:MAG: hypothetical protein ABIQ12_13150 [Opitutaceae bacterium]